MQYSVSVTNRKIDAVVLKFPSIVRHQKILNSIRQKKVLLATIRGEIQREGETANRVDKGWER